MDKRVLVVDGDQEIQEAVTAALEPEGFRVASVADGDAARDALESGRPFDLVIVDLAAPGVGGFAFLEYLQRTVPGTETLVTAALEHSSSSLEAMQLGAAHYLRKPFAPAEVAHAARRTLLEHRLVVENQSLRSCIQTFEAARPLTTCVETADVLPLALDVIGQALGRERAVGRLLDVSERPADGIYLRGFPEDAAAVLRSQIEAGKLFDPANLDSRAGSSAGLQTALARLGLDDDDLLELRLVVEGRVVGGLWVFSEGKPFDEDEVRRAELVVQHVELAVANAERFVQAREKAFIDDVTGLYNARYLLAALDREVNRSGRAENELSVLFLDIDRFKLVNDQYGHLVGSRALKELGVVLLQSVRAVDTVGRYGGDEFTILLVDTGREGACQVAERIREMVSETDFGTDRGLKLAITVSIGVATFPRHGDSREALLDQADKAMYLAKALGRDKVCTADELSQPIFRAPAGPSRL